MLSKLKDYLQIKGNTKDSLLMILIEDAEVAFEDMTNRNPAEHETIIFRMVVEDYNRYGSEGIASLSFGSGAEAVLEDYSAGLQKQIRRLKKVRVL